MGAKNIILVGCDNCALSENHHAHNQHTLWKNESPDLRYMQYYLGLREIRSALKTRKINVLSLTPFLKLNDPELDFKMLCKEANKPLFIQNDDIYQGLSMYRYNMRYLNLSRIMIKKNLSWLLKSISNIFFKKK
jgi:hypothetical protein